MALLSLRSLMGRQPVACQYDSYLLSLATLPADSIATCQKKRSGEQTGRSEGKRQIKGKKTLLSIAYEIT